MKTRSRKSNNKTRKFSQKNNVIHGGLMGLQKKDFVKELELLHEQCKTVKGRRKLLDENLAFVATITGAIAMKNKLDFPPAGPFTEDKIKYQDARIRYILQGISEFNIIDSETIINSDDEEPDVRKQYVLGAWGAAHQTAMNVNAFASKSLRTGKALTDWSIKKEYKTRPKNVVSRQSLSPLPSVQPPLGQSISPAPSLQTPLSKSLSPNPSYQPIVSAHDTTDFNKDVEQNTEKKPQAKKSWF